MPLRAVDDNDTMATSTAMLHENNLRIIAEMFQRLELLEFLLVRHANTNPPAGEGKGTLSLVLYPRSGGLPMPFTLTRDSSGCPRLCRVCRCRQPSRALRAGPGAGAPFSASLSTPSRASQLS